MYVVKRDGRRELVLFDKIYIRLKELSKNILGLEHCDPMLVAQKVIARVYSGITTIEIDEIAAETAAAMSIDHHDYALLAKIIVVWNLHKTTKSSFSETIKDLYNNMIKVKDRVSGIVRRKPLVAGDVYEIIMKNAELLDNEIMDDRDYQYDYFGFKTLEASCLLKIEGKVVERPQYMLMRVAIGIHKDDIVSAIKTYHLMSQHWFTHSPSTLLNAGTPVSQLSSCSLVSTEKESIEGSPACVYLEPWHYDILEFLDTRKKHRKEEQRGLDVFYSLWVPKLFMRRVEEDGGGQWSLFCPEEAPGLADCWGQEFEDLYMQYEREGKAKEVVSARSLWVDILLALLQSRTPSVVFKDTCNRKSNQQNLVKSNCFTEIIERTTPLETASIALPQFVRKRGVPIESQPSKLVGSRDSKNRYFDFDKLAEVTSFVTTNLNKLIDINYSRIDTAKKSGLELRRIGIGVQGLADTFILLGIPFDSPEAKQLNKDIFETIYYHALKASSELAAIEGSYETYQGSPASKGILQPDLWGVTPSDRWNWSTLKEMISSNGIRNSLLVAAVPSASSSQILCNSVCFAPYNSNIYKRRVLSGGFDVVNKHLLHDLTEMGRWSPALKEKIISRNGSIRNISKIPGGLKAIYKTACEIKQTDMVDMAIDRGCYIDQSQILDIHVDQPKSYFLFNLYASKKGLKTGVYSRRHVRAKLIKLIDYLAAKDLSAKKSRLVC